MTYTISLGVYLQRLRRYALPVSLSSSLLLASCGGQAVNEFFVQTFDGGIPVQSRGLMSSPLAEVRTKALARDLGGAFELARRYENGIGMKADVQCAVFWYYTADTIPYPQCPNCTNAVAAEMRPGLVHAQAAFRRLVQQPDADLAVNPTRPGHSEAFRRCSDAVISADT